jgi:hypothetical protein
MSTDMDDEDMQFSTGWIASVVRHLCDIEEQLTKDEFVRIARAMANILLVASGHNDTLIDTRDDEFAAMNAEIIQEIRLGVLAQGG